MKPHILLLLPFLLAPVIGEAETRKFSDTTGREIEAELIAVQGEQVRMKMGGKEFTLPINRFSEADAKYIKEWGEANPAPLNIRGMYVKFEKNMERLKEPKPTDGKKGKGPEQKRMSVDYSITVENTSDQDLDDLKLKYTIYKAVRERTGNETTEKLEKTEGEEAIGQLEKTSDHSVTTPAVIATDSEGGGKKDEPKTSHSETILGVVAVVYSGDKEIRTESYPDGLAERMEAKQEESE